MTHFTCLAAGKMGFYICQELLGRSTMTQFTFLAARKMEIPYLDSTNYAASVQEQHNEFISRFPEIRRDKIKVKLLAHPFRLAVGHRPDYCQMELIELQADMDTKRGYSENSLVDFYMQNKLSTS